MKRSVLALAVTLGAVTSMANAAEIYNKDGNKLDLYGRVNGKHLFITNSNSQSKEDGDRSYVRLGFKGETQVNDQLTGYGQWEYQFQADKTESADALLGSKTRLGFAGLKLKDYGSFDYGRNYGVVYDVESFTDMLPEFGGDSYTRTDNFMTGRSTGVATYRNRDFFGLVQGLNVALQYQGKNEGRDMHRQNGDGYGLSAVYQDIGGSGISAAAAYSDSNRTEAQKNAVYGKGDGSASAWTTGLKYDANQVYLATMYAETRNMTPITVGGVKGVAKKTQNVEIVAQYQFENGLRPSLAYVQSKGKGIEGIGDADLVKYIDIGAIYYFNKNMYTYVDYKINQMNDDGNKLGLNNDNIVATSLTYRF